MSQATQTQQASLVLEHVVEKLRMLSAERLGEVEDFIDFLSHRDNDRQLTRDGHGGVGTGAERCLGQPGRRRV